MTILRPPLDPFSEVLDQRRRWTPDWYAWLSEVQALLASLEPISGSAGSTWTPTLTFATPGDLSVTYSTRNGFYYTVGSLIYIQFAVLTSAFTWTTSAGLLRITGLPFATRNDSNRFAVGSVDWRGITKATYTQIVPLVDPGTTVIRFDASGSGVAISNVIATDVPSAGTVGLFGSLTYVK